MMVKSDIQYFSSPLHSRAVCLAHVYIHSKAIVNEVRDGCISIREFRSSLLYDPSRWMRRQRSSKGRSPERKFNLPATKKTKHKTSRTQNYLVQGCSNFMVRRLRRDAQYMETEKFNPERDTISLFHTQH